MCREGQSRRSKRVLTHHKRLVSENLEREVIFLTDTGLPKRVSWDWRVGELSHQASGARRREDGSPAGPG